MGPPDDGGRNGENKTRNNTVYFFEFPTRGLPAMASLLRPKAAAAKRAFAQSKIKVKLSSFTLAGETRTGSVIVEVDMPGEDEPMRAKPAPFKTSGSKAILIFEQLYEAGAGSVLAQALGDALVTSQSTDSEILFVVFHVEKDGPGGEAELGMAKLSLEGLLEAGKDASNVALPVLGDSGNGAKVGELVVTVTALQAMREIYKAAMGEEDDATSREGGSSRQSGANATAGGSPAPTKTPASAAPPPAQPNTVGVYFQSLALEVSGREPPEKAPPLRARIELLGLSPQQSAPLKLGKGMRAAPAFFAPFPIGAGTELRASLASQLPKLGADAPVISVTLTDEPATAGR